MQILHVGIAAILRLSAFGLLLMSMVVLSGCGDDGKVPNTPTPQAGGPNINDELRSLLDLNSAGLGALGTFAPMIKKGVAMPGA